MACVFPLLFVDFWDIFPLSHHHHHHHNPKPYPISGPEACHLRAIIEIVRSWCVKWKERVVWETNTWMYFFFFFLLLFRNGILEGLGITRQINVRRHRA